MPNRGPAMYNVTYNIVVPIAGAVIDAAEKFLTHRAQPSTKPEPEEEPIDPHKTPRAAIQGRPRSKSFPQTPSLPTSFPTPLIVNPVKEEEDSEDYEIVDMEDDSWTKINFRHDTNRRSDLSVPTSKEDSQYEDARRRYITQGGSPEKDCVKAGRKVIKWMGTPKEEDAMKLFVNERRGFDVDGGFAGSHQRQATIAGGVEKVDDAKIKPSSRSSNAVGGVPTGSGIDTEDDYFTKLTRKSVWGVRNDVTKDDQPSPPKPQSRPTRSATVKLVDDEEYITKPMTHLVLLIPRRTKPVISSRRPDNTISWRSGRKSITTADGKAKADVEAVREQHRDTKIKHQESTKDDNRRGRAHTKHHPVYNYNLISYRKRAQSVDSAKWSTSDSEFERELRDEPPEFVENASHYASRLQDGDDNGRTGWRVPMIDFDQSSKRSSTQPTQKRSMQATVKSEDETPIQRSTHNTMTPSSTAKTSTLATRQTPSANPISKGMSDFDKDQFGVNYPEDEFDYSNTFDLRDKDFFTQGEYEFGDKKRAKLKAEMKKRADRKGKEQAVKNLSDSDEFFDAEEWKGLLDRIMRKNGPDDAQRNHGN